jgi:hypothetical protein
MGHFEGACKCSVNASPHLALWYDMVMHVISPALSSTPSDAAICAALPTGCGLQCTLIWGLSAGRQASRAISWVSRPTISIPSNLSLDETSTTTEVVLRDASAIRIKLVRLSDLTLRSSSFSYQCFVPPVALWSRFVESTEDASSAAEVFSILVAEGMPVSQALVSAALL